MTARYLLVISAAALIAGGASGAPATSVRPHDPIPSSWQIHPNESTKFDTPPKLIHGEGPIYPISRLLQRKSGGAVIEFTVDQHGDTRDFKVVSADYLYYANHAIVAVQKWKFQPALKKGRPMAVRVRVPFAYRIR